MRARVLGVSLLCLLSLPACSLSRSVIGGPGPGNDASIDAMSIDAHRDDTGTDAGSDTGIDSALPDTGPDDAGDDAGNDAGNDTGTDAFVPPNDAGNDAFVPPNDAGSDAGPCALCTGAQMCCSLACVDTTNDVNHCGSCSACATVANATSGCTASTCMVAGCTTGFSDCNGMYADGCETTLGTTNDCSFCGDVCQSFPNTTSACGGSGCTYVCSPGYTSCSATSPDCETHTDVDPLNCGACGHACHTGQTCTAGACHGWGAMSTTGAPAGRSQHTAVWTGTQMIVWGGTTGTAELGTGARYDPATDTWTAVSTTGAPSARRGHAAVWTGTRMIVWGGYRIGAGWLNDGASYDPGTDTWTALPGTPPAARSRMGYAFDDVHGIFFVFGGWDATSVRGDGSMFDGAAWTTTTTSGDPSARRYLPVVWTGTRFLVWGGEQATGVDIGNGVPTSVLQDGGRFDPVANAWSNITNTGRPAGRSHHLAVWTGTQMIVWSGYNAMETRLTSGGRYTLSSDSWAATSAAPIGGRIGGTAVWSGSRMLIWGGTDVAAFTVTYWADGAAYDPAGDAWTTLPTTGAPTGRTDHTAVWDGTEMIVWGGTNATTALADGAVFAP